MMEIDEIKRLISPILLDSLPGPAYEGLRRYIDLLFRWNSRMNLTAIRDPQVLVGLHLAECLRAAQLIPAGIGSLLDFGSGAGLPGIPIQIARPEIAVTLAESQSKKAAFLREAVREIPLPSSKVFASRVESMPPERQFGVVALRAVDRMDLALKAAGPRIQPDGLCMVLTSESETCAVSATLPGFDWSSDAVPGTKQRVILLGSRRAESVPRETN